jgi:hypothetical protein
MNTVELIELLQKDFETRGIAEVVLEVATLFQQPGITLDNTHRIGGPVLTYMVGRHGENKHHLVLIGANTHLRQTWSEKGSQPLVTIDEDEANKKDAILIAMRKL